MRSSNSQLNNTTFDFTIVMENMQDIKKQFRNIDKRNEHFKQKLQRLHNQFVQRSNIKPKEKKP